MGSPALLAAASPHGRVGRAMLMSLVAARHGHVGEEEMPVTSFVTRGSIIGRWWSSSRSRSALRSRSGNEVKP